MMYVPYPALEPAERLAVLEKISGAHCCQFAPLKSRFAQHPTDSVTVERWGTRTLLRTKLSSGIAVLIDAASGEDLDELARPELLEVGRSIGRRLGYESKRVRTVQTDQWTVHSRFDDHRPMLLFESADHAQWYVSGKTGELVQYTQQEERFWNWIGSVVHWLYPTMLRQNTAVWAQTVIWLTIVALFLTLTGLVFGLKQYRSATHRTMMQGATPYTGWSKWHHNFGLFFGLFMLSWLLSGLFSMNPWGALEGRSFAPERARLLGDAASLSELLQELQGASVPNDTVRIDVRRNALAIQRIAYTHEGKLTLIDSTSQPPNATEVARTARPGVPVSIVETLNAPGDAYYYGHHQQKNFPVVKAVYVDGERLYFHAVTGELLLGIDRSRAWYRWIFNGVHTGDFLDVVRHRPFWDLWMLVLISGLVVGSGSGVVLAIRRLVR